MLNLILLFILLQPDIEFSKGKVSAVSLRLTNGNRIERIYSGPRPAK